MSNSSHFPPISASKLENPVMLLPGCAKLSTKPLPTGSAICANTAGMVRLTCCSAATPGLLCTKITSGVSATSSAAAGRMRSMPPPTYRKSICRSWPSLQPSSCSCCRNAAMRTFPSASFSLKATKAPIRRVRSVCACAASGNATALPNVAMNSRRLMGRPPSEGPQPITSVAVVVRHSNVAEPMSALCQKRT